MPAFGTTPERLLAALRRTEEYWPVLREQRWQRIREADLQWAAMVEQITCGLPGAAGADERLGLLCGWRQR